METVSMKCPNCMGDVVPFGNGAYGRCNSCDSVFKLKDEKDVAASGAQADEAEDDEDEDDEEAFDFEEFFQDAYDDLDDADVLSDAFYGDRLDDNHQKVDQAVKRFGIDDDDADEVYFVLDTTILGSCKVGLAVTVSGIYLVDEDGDSGFLDWDDYADCDIERDGGRMTIGGHPFIMSSSEARVVTRLMRDLRDE